MYQAPPKLSNVHILLADGDLYMAGILVHMLHTLGFANVSRASNGQKALDLIETKGADILITEWTMDGLNGLDLAQYLRDPVRSPNLTMPFVMMTGRAERHNVTQARDRGVTEFLVKPVTTAMLYDRIRRLFDHPRDFVIDASYVGPDRRHRTYEERGNSEQRTAKPIYVSSADHAMRTSERPVIVSKNHALRRKANITSSLSAIITKELLAKADKVIDSYRDESEQWIKDDVMQLERAVNQIIADLPGAADRVQNCALSLKSRAGTFGYDMAAKVAFGLYVFVYHDFKASFSSHILILRKHLEVLKVLLAGRKLGHTQQMEEELTGELLKMTNKLKEVGSNPQTFEGATA